jgi:hypothetical protein
VIDSVIVRWPSSLISKLGSTTDINQKIIIKENCNLKLMGNVYFDENNNGQKDTNESGIADRRILISPGNFLGYTDEYGDYSVFVNPGTYDVAVAQSTDLYQSQPKNYGTYNVTINALQNPIGSGLDFGLTDKCTNPDLSVDISSRYFHREDYNRYEIKILNESKFNNAKKFDLLVALSDNATLDEENYKSKSHDGTTTTYLFEFSDLDALDSTTLILGDIVDVDPHVGETIDISVQIEYTEDECTLINNTASTHSIVSKISEHNRKEVSVNTVSNASAGLHTYKIFYQNVGIASTDKIVIRDTLSKYLEWTTFKMVSSTHNFTVTQQDDVITWTLENANIPNKSTDEKASKGEIIFSIYPIDKIQVYNVIENKAYISLGPDLNIETNVVISSFEYKTEFSVFKNIVLYPNPNPGKFNVTLVNDKNNLENINQIDIIDLRGRLIHSITPNALRVDVDISYLAGEIYILKVYDIFNNITYSKVMKE